MALIGHHNISSARTINRFVYITGDEGLVWMLIPSSEAQERFNRGELENDKVARYLTDKDNIGIWITPCPSGLYKYYIRAATGDLMKDFQSLILSRAKTPDIIELSIKDDMKDKETVEHFFKRNDYFKKYKRK